jgi:plastocyanin
LGSNGADVPPGAQTIRRRWLRAALAVGAFCAAAHAQVATLEVRVAQRDGQPLPGAVVTVERESAPLGPAPDVLVIPVHSSVQFPNSDAVGHQVYSFSSARQFQLPLYRGKPYPPVQFDQPGVVTLGCNIHDNMLAYVIVTAAPFFGRTDAQGKWLAAEVPEGRYRVRVWHPLLNESREVEGVAEIGGGHATLELELSNSLRPAPLGTRPHSWDY